MSANPTTQVELGEWLRLIVEAFKTEVQAERDLPTGSWSIPGLPPNLSVDVFNTSGTEIRLLYRGTDAQEPRRQAPEIDLPEGVELESIYDMRRDCFAAMLDLSYLRLLLQGCGV